MADERVTVSTGVVFRLKRPALFAFQAVARQHLAMQPHPPRVFLDAKGREEENPNDPAYVSRLNEWNTALVERQYEVLLATGTTPETVPDGVPGIESEEWPELLEAIGIEPKAGKTARYIQWVKYVAAPAGADLQALFQPLLKLLGATEDEVTEAVSTFRSGTAGDTDPGVPANGVGEHGDNLAAVAAGARAAL